MTHTLNISHPAESGPVSLSGGSVIAPPVILIQYTLPFEGSGGAPGLLVWLCPLCGRAWPRYAKVTEGCWPQRLVTASITAHAGGPCHDVSPPRPFFRYSSGRYILYHWP